MRRLVQWCEKNPVLLFEQEGPSCTAQLKSECVRKEVKLHPAKMSTLFYLL